METYIQLYPHIHTYIYIDVYSLLQGSCSTRCVDHLTAAEARIVLKARDDRRNQASRLLRGLCESVRGHQFDNLFTTVAFRRLAGPFFRVADLLRLFRRLETWNVLDSSSWKTGFDLAAI